MAEVSAGAALPLSVIWVERDWLEAPPLVRLAAQTGVTLEFPAYEVAGLRADQPRLAMARLSVAAPCTLARFIEKWLTPAAQARLSQGDIGIAVYGRRGRTEQLLRTGDRIELLGPITADPKSNRLKRVKADRSDRGRDKWRTVRAN